MERRTNRARRNTAPNRENRHDKRPPRGAATIERCSRGVPRAKALKEPVRLRSALPAGRCFGLDVRKKIQAQANRADDAAAWMALVIIAVPPWSVLTPRSMRAPDTRRNRISGGPPWTR